MTLTQHFTQLRILIGQTPFLPELSVRAPAVPCVAHTLHVYFLRSVWRGDCGETTPRPRLAEAVKGEA